MTRPRFDPRLFILEKDEPEKSAPSRPTLGQVRIVAKRHNNQAQLLEALSFIDPDDYDIWRTVGMALHHDSPEDNLQTWTDWSIESDKYNEGDCEEKWLTFGDYQGGKVVTLGTVFYLAEKAGWIRVDKENYTDLGNARRLVRMYGTDIKFVPEFDKWLIWDGVRWVIEDERILQLAKKVTERMHIEARDLDDENRSKLIRHALASESANRLKAMVELAKTEPGVTIHQCDLDTDPFLLNLLNGTLDLKTGRLRTHDREDYLTKLALVEYDPTAQAPLWEKFLDRIMNGNQAVIEYLQRAVGYSLSGDTGEQCMFFLYGTGANGKSTALNILRTLLSDHAMQASADTLMVKQHNGSATPDLARLRGARMVTTSEVEDGQRFAESAIKQMTGQDTLTVRHLYAPPFEYKPNFKIWLAANHRPVVRGSDHAIWRRIHLIPFTVTIPEEERDKHLEKKLRRELPGILTWAVAGCLEWQKKGLAPPSEVKSATEDYRQEMDSIGQWLSECCEVDAQAQTFAADLYKSYEAWTRDNGMYALSNKRLGMELAERGFVRHKGRVISYRGVKLINSEFLPVATK